MSQEKYDLMFSGELVPGFELGQAKKNIQALFRIDEARVDVLFSGKAITLKKGLDAEAANKYRVAMKKAGARVSVVQAEPANEAPPLANSKPPALGERSAGAPGREGSVSTSTEQAPMDRQRVGHGGDGLSTDLGAQPTAKASVRRQIEAPDYQVAEKGADMLAGEYRLPLAELEIDTSALSVAPQEGRLVREEELERPAAVAVRIPQIDVAPAGSDVLAPEERPKVQAVDVDVSRLSLAGVGERLSAPNNAAPAPPNVDHIKLKD